MEWATKHTPNRIRRLRQGCIRASCSRPGARLGKATLAYAYSETEGPEADVSPAAGAAASSVADQVILHVWIRSSLPLSRSRPSKERAAPIPSPSKQAEAGARSVSHASTSEIDSDSNACLPCQRGEAKANNSYRSRGTEWLDQVRRAGSGPGRFRLSA